MEEVTRIQCVGPEEAAKMSDELQCDNAPIKNYVVISRESAKKHDVQSVFLGHSAYLADADDQDQIKYNEVA